MVPSPTEPGKGVWGHVARVSYRIYLVTSCYTAPKNVVYSGTRGGILWSCRNFKRWHYLLYGWALDLSSEPLELSGSQSVTELLY